MRLSLRQTSRPALLLWAVCLILVLAFPSLYGRNKNNSSIRNRSPVLDEPFGPLGDDHWTDAKMAQHLVSGWLIQSPSDATLSIPRKDIVWVQALMRSAARQAEAGQKQTLRQTALTPADGPSHSAGVSFPTKFAGNGYER